MGKMIRKRNHLEVMHDILETVQKSHNSIMFTPLLRKSGISSQSFAGYYSELLSKKLIKEIGGDGGKKYVTLTDRGFRFLEKYSTILGFIDEFEL